MIKSTTPQFEHLEERLTPTTMGTPWLAPDQLTVSFAPDGTLINQASSNLFQSLNAQNSTAAWKLQVLKALQTWAVNANINIGVVADGGQPLGTPGLIQGD